MTDKKHEELLKCAEVLIDALKDAGNVAEWDEYRALKACLPPPPPSREQIVEYFDYWANENDHPTTEEETLYLNAAIEELRK